MSDVNWYAVVEGADLEQGDVLLRVPVYTLTEFPDPPADALPPVADVVMTDLVVMTQSCDLLQDKVESVLLAQLEIWADFVRANVSRGNTVVQGKEFRKKLVDGVLPAYALLNRHEGPPPLPWCLVNFHRLQVLPKPYVRTLAAARSPRLRLRPPYLEHLSQALARYFMRVGLPHPLHDFIKEGDVR
jgi:hypothetical protein